jgi:hypothetical protein
MNRPTMTKPTLALVALTIALMIPMAAGADGLLTATADTARLSVMPSRSLVQAGDTLLVELTVPVAGPAFNGYDAYLLYDPAVLQFLPAANVSTQEGPLMTTACGLRFHVFKPDTLAGQLRVSHSLMCAGVSVTGPGVVYRVRLRARAVDADTPLSLLLAAPYKTAFYLAGTVLTPLATTGAVVRVGAGSPSAVPVPRVGVSGLRVAPNPFNPRTQIAFEAEQAGPVTVDVHAVDGRRVRTLWQGDVAAGTWHHDWDGCDDRGRPVAAGVYLVRLRTGAEVLTTRATLVR